MEEEEFNSTNKLLKWIYILAFIITIFIIFITRTNLFFEDNYQYNDKNGYKLDTSNSYIYSNGIIDFYLTKNEKYDNRIRFIELNLSKISFESINSNCKLINFTKTQEEIRKLAVKNHIYLRFKCDSLEKYSILTGKLNIVESQQIYGRSTDYFNNIINFEFKVR